MIEYYDVFKNYNDLTGAIGLLAYDTDIDCFSMYIAPDKINRRLYPTLFGLKGDKEPTDSRVRNWIENRTTPPDRIGIEGILQALNLKEYNGWEILKAANGRNPGCDSWAFSRTDCPNPDYAKRLTWSR